MKKQPSASVKPRNHSMKASYFKVREVGFWLTLRKNDCTLVVSWLILAASSSLTAKVL